MPQPFDRHNFVAKALIAFGSNATSPAGTPKETVMAALRDLPCDSVQVTAESRLYQTPCVPKGAGPDFVNGVIAVTTHLSATALLARCHQIEARFDRVRRVRWGARSLDLDIIDYAGQTLPDLDTFAHWRDLPPDLHAKEAPDGLVLPHPRLQDRAFVLVPLADVAPDWVHPVSGLSLTQMLARLPAADAAAITAL